MLRCLFIATIVLLCELADCQPQYRFQHFDTSDGLASDLSTNIIQDSLGFLWISHGSGFTRYDGYNFKVYNRDSDDPLNAPRIPESSGMVLDHSGNLWLLPMNPAKYYELFKYVSNTDKFVQYRVRLAETPRVHRLFFERDNKSVWMATTKGLYTFTLDSTQINEAIIYSADLPDPLAQQMSNHIFDLYEQDSVILLATEKGLWTFNKRQKTFRRPQCNPKDSTWLYNTTFYDIFNDRRENSEDVWVVDNHAFSRLDKDLFLQQRVELPGGRSKIGVMGFDQDKGGVFWMGTWYNGFCRMDPADSSFQFIKKIPGDPTSLRADLIREVMSDRNENIWLTTSRGISRLQRQDITFYNHEITKGKIDISMVYQCNGSDYIIIDKNDGQNHLMMAPVIPDHLDSLVFKQITPPLRGAQGNGFWKGQRTFWMTLWGVGVIGLPIDEKTGMIQPGPVITFGHDPGNPNTISSPFTTSPWEDANGDLWVGSINALNKVVTAVSYGSNGSVRRYQHVEGDSTSIIDDHALGFYPNDGNSFWIFTLAGVDLYSGDRFHHFYKNSREPKAIHESKDGVLSIGTAAGLYEGINIDGQYHFTKAAPLQNSDIVAIHEDLLGRLWISTKRGIVFYDRNESVAIEFNEKDGFLHKRMAHGGLRPNLTSQGIMVLADFDGLSLFDPSSLRIDRSKTQPLLVNLTVNNQSAKASAASEEQQFSTEADIAVLDELILDYKHNNFTLEFSAMEFTSPEKNRYRHKLEGYDKEWIDTDASSRTATYTNLDPGTYVFKVKASNYHGIWNDNERKLTVIILPPPWQTWWAYTLYGLLFIFIVLYWRSYEIKRIRLKQRAAHLTEIDHLKTRFFANISHEFRTPITLILGPLKDLYNKSDEEQRSLFAIMIRNGERLLRLINQLLDLSKIEAGKMHLRLTNTELVSFLREIASAYESIAADKKIRYNFYSAVNALNLYVDQEKIEKVVHNLLSNAFKFTTRGEVTIILRLKGKEWVEIAVTDTGHGIPQEEIAKIFDRFYQVDSSQTRAYEGSGLGMALAKELIELHHGRISVESILGSGTTFTALLPLSKEVFRKEEVMHPADLSENGKGYEYPNVSYPLATTPEENGDPTPSQEQPLILIVEDNADMRNYIRRTLAESYRVLEAVDGKEGVNKAVETIPDLIISDIMMPEMDGYKLCEHLKKKEMTSHIPVILLTAKADRESKLGGLETGADDYLSKPFDVDELKLIIRNRIEQRRKMRERFSREITLEPRQIAITSLDERFLSRVMDIIEFHMDDEHFSVSTLSLETGYSNMQFYRKIKGLTGQSPNHFLRTIRLKRAAELLSHKSDNVAQIAYGVGFSSQSYFIKCFKEQFGVTPGEYMQKH